jgi:hypothetical protein
MLAEIVARLQAQAPSLVAIEGAAAYAVLKTAPPLHRLPSAFVVPLAEEAGENRLATGIAQRVVAGYGVVLIVPGDRADRVGAAPSIELETLRRETHAALLGWQPSAATEPFLFVGGELLRFQGDALWWQDSFSTAYALRLT